MEHACLYETYVRSMQDLYPEQPGIGRSVLWQAREQLRAKQGKARQGEVRQGKAGEH